MKRGAHLRIDPRSVIAERLVWTGMSVVGLSVVTLGLYAVYQTLSATFTGVGTALAAGPIKITVMLVMIGLALSGIGSLTASSQRKRGRATRRRDSHRRIAA